MAKLKPYKYNMKKGKTERIDSISGEAYINDYEMRLRKSRKLKIENHKTIIESKMKSVD